MATFATFAFNLPWSIDAVALALLAVSAVAVLVAARRSIAFALVLTVVALVAASSIVDAVKTPFLTARWGALAALCVAVLLPPIVSLTISRVHVLAAVGIAVAGFSAAWSVDGHLTVLRAATFGALLFAVFALVRQTPRRENGEAELISALAPLPLLALAASLILLVFSPDLALRTGELRGVFENPNGLGIFLGLTYPALYSVLDRRYAGALRVALTALPFAAAIAFTGSRSGFVAFVAAVVVYEIARGKRVRLGLQIACMLLVSLGLALTALVIPRLGEDRLAIAGIGRPEGMSFFTAVTGGRNEAWEAAVSLITVRPLQGFGFGTGDQLFARFPEHTDFLYFYGSLPHNGYLQLLLELGCVGAFPFFLLLGIAARNLVLRVRSTNMATSKAAFAGVLAAGLVGSLGESLLTAAGAPWPILIWLAAAVFLPRGEAKIPAHEGDPNGAGSASGLSALLWTHFQSDSTELANVAGKRVLALGCGDGEWARALAEQGAHTVAMDFSLGRLRLARILLDEAGLDVPLFLAQDGELPADAATFDIVCLDSDAGFFSDPRRTVSEVVRVLRPGGVLAVVTTTRSIEEMHVLLDGEGVEVEDAVQAFIEPEGQPGEPFAPAFYWQARKRQL